MDSDDDEDDSDEDDDEYVFCVGIVNASKNATFTCLHFFVGCTNLYKE